MSASAEDEQIQEAIGQLPALPPPPGVTPNFVNPPSKLALANINPTVIFPVVTIFVLLRMYIKRFINRSGLGIEDYTCLLAWFGLITYNALAIWEHQFGDGVHEWNVTIVKAMHFARTANYLEIAYTPTICFTKLALLFSLLKLFGGIHRGGTYWLCHITIWFNLLFYTAVLLVAIFACWPREKIWDPLLPGKCVDPIAILIASSAINCATDIVILVLPIVMVWRLQMSKHRKWSVSAIFATGAFACVCSLMRVVSAVRLIGDQDLTYDLVDQSLWANGEVGSGIVAGCMLSMPQLFRHLMPKFKSFYGSRKTTQTPRAPQKLSNPGDPWTQSSSPSYVKGMSRSEYLELEETGSRPPNASRSATDTIEMP